MARPVTAKVEGKPPAGVRRRLTEPVKMVKAASADKTVQVSAYQPLRVGKVGDVLSGGL